MLTNNLLAACCIQDRAVTNGFMQALMAEQAASGTSSVSLSATIQVCDTGPVSGSSVIWRPVRKIHVSDMLHPQE